ncbi:hypothetical protein KR222_004870, partial [Zaprionus bogoriensis]
LLVLFAYAAAWPEKQLAAAADATGAGEVAAVSEASLVALSDTQSIEAAVTPSILPPSAGSQHQPSAERADPLPAITPAVTTTVASPSAGSSNVPDYLRNCFYAEEELCLNWHHHNVSGHEAVPDHPDSPGNTAVYSEGGEGASATANSAENQTSSNAQNGSHAQNRDRDANSCQCREHPSRPNAWYCCNIPHISMISSCGNISKWVSLHVRNLTVPAMDLSNPIYRSLQSLAVTDGNIMQLTNAFLRHSKLKCLNISNNNISEIAPRAVKDVPHLEFLGIANNLLTRVPNGNQNKNIALDISGNMRMLCEQLNGIIFTDSSFFIVNPERSFCLYNATHKWFNSTDLVSVGQLESIKKCGTKCPSIPNYGNCICNTYSIMIIQNDESRTVCNVDCSNLGLVELPPQLPDNTFTLNISNNRISSLGDHFHTNPTYYNIVKLVADNNHISSIYEFEGTKFIEHFQRLYLRNNSLSKIPEYFLNNALMDTDGRRIYLAENRLQCDCNSAKTLQNWLKERSTDIPDYMDIRCRNLPESVIELQESKLCQSPPDWTDYIYYLIAAEIILLLALITKVSYDYWVFKTAGYLPWPASKMPKLPCDWLCES